MENYNFSIRIRVKKTDSPTDFSFGKGVAQLLTGIEEYASLNQAAKHIGMAYSKAWKKIKETEEHLGFPLIERLGAKGSRLTREGAVFLNYYRQAETAALETIKKIYQDLSDD